MRALSPSTNVWIGARRLAGFCLLLLLLGCAMAAFAQSVAGVGTQSITFESPTVYAGGPRTLSASGGASGNPVVFNSTTPAICTTSGANGATLTRVAVGACVITANQAAGAGFAAAPQVSVTSYTPQRERLAASNIHTLALRADGSVWATGENDYGQLGDGTYTASKVFKRAGTATNYTSVAAGRYFSAALRADGTLWSWGASSNGLPTPEQFGTVSNWIAIAACDFCLGAIRADGSLWTTNNVQNGLFPSGSGPWIAIAANLSEFVLIRADGTLWVLGGAGFTEVDADTSWIQVATETGGESGGGDPGADADNPTKYALRADGTLWAWGGNSCGEIGDGGSNPSALYTSPTQIGYRTNWVEIKTGLGHTLARRRDGSLWAFGCNNNGQLGLGRSEWLHSAPVQVGCAMNWDAIATGSKHSIALRSDGTLWAWGNHASGQLGHGNGDAAAIFYPIYYLPVQSPLGAYTTPLAADCPVIASGPGAGSLDPLDANLIGDYVLATAVQLDGKSIIAGKFTSVLGVPRQNIARLNADGTLDLGFDPRANDVVRSVAVQVDGRVLLGGEFTALQPGGAVSATARNRIARVNADGTLDTGFNPNANGGVYSLAVQADGKVLLGGNFSALQPGGAAGATTRNRIARVNADGTLDLSFDPNANNIVRALAVQADGKVLLGGEFTALQPNGAGATVRRYIARVQPDGTLDLGFNPNPNGSVYCLAVQADRKILFGGEFNYLEPNGGFAHGAGRLARVHPDGTGELSFYPNPNGFVHSIAVQADGKVLVGGLFTLLDASYQSVAGGARSGIGRLQRDGRQDLGFDPYANGGVFSIAVRADGTVLLGGEFSTLQPNGAGAATVRNRFALLANDPATQSLTIPSASRVQWQRDGTAPELEQVRFELSTNGGASYSPLGAGTRDGRAWERGGLSLPASGHIRARGRSAGSLVETVQSFSGFTFNVKPSAGAHGTITPSATQTVSLGATPTFTVTPGPGYAASVGGTCGGVLVGTSYTTTPVAADCTVIASFTNYSVTVTASAGSNGTISPASAQSVIAGASVVFTVTPNAGYRSVVGGSCGGNLSRNIYTTRPLYASCTVTASFITLQAGPGDPDPLDASLNGDFVLATALQPDGKSIIAGKFTSVLGVPRQNIARLNTDGTLDLGFDPRAGGTVKSVALQADGKVLLGGEFTTLQPGGAATATVRQYIARLNADGTLDTGFDPRANNIVESVAVQADGKVVLVGNFTTLQPGGAGATTTRNRIARLNADGTPDPDFNPNANNVVYSVAVQADGKVLLGGEFSELQPGGAGAATVRRRIARVHADGTLDAGFNPTANGAVLSVAVQADGKVLLGGSFTRLQPGGAGADTARNRIARVHADGTLDVGFDPNANDIVESVAVQADGKVLIGGFFTTLKPNGAGEPTVRRVIARLNSDGTLDMGFVDPNANDGVYSVAVQADGKVLLGGAFTSIFPNGTGSAIARNRFARLVNEPATQRLTVPNASRVQWLRGGASPELEQVRFELSTNGGKTYGPLGAGTRISGGWELGGLSLPTSGHIRARGRTAGGFQNGTGGMVETALSFSAVTYTVTPSASANGTISPAMAQSVNAGSTAVFTVTPNVGYRASVAGTCGGSLSANSYTTHPVKSSCTVIASFIALQAGDLDPLDANLIGGYVTATAVQPDGKTIIAGKFTSVLGVPRQNIARLNADGTLDLGFDPNANEQVRSVAVQPDGKVVLGGVFTTLQPGGAGAATARNLIARVNADGTLDMGFDPNPNSFISSVAVQADGKVLLGGHFTALQPNGAVAPTTRNRIARVNADGTLDPSFDPNADSPVQSLAVQADGKVLLGGYFSTLQPNGAVAATARNFIARVHSDGVLDTGFDPNPNAAVISVAVQADGRVLLGGNFTALQSGGSGGSGGAGAATARNRFARLLNDPATQSLTIPNASRVQWLRGGAAPELEQVRFELSTNGGTSYSALGAGTRISGGWERTGLSLPGSGHIRARGRTAGGFQNGTGGMVETGLSFSGVTFTVTPSAGANGSITPAAAQMVSSGATSSFTVTPNNGFSATVGGTCTGSLVGSTYTTNPITANCTVSASFTLNTYAVTPSAAANGTISPNILQTINHGATTSFTVTPNAGYSATVGGSCGGSLVGTTYTTNPITANCTVIAAFITVPSAPQLVSVVPLDQAARLAFNAPGSDGGSAILDYTASCTPGTHSATANVLSIDVTGLGNNTAYRCSVRARNAVGSSAPSTQLSVIPGSGGGNTADFSITKTNASNFVNGADYVAYTITVSNAGPAAAISTRVEDAIGAGTDFSAALWTCTPLNNAACPNPANGSGSLNALVDLPANSSVRFNFAALPTSGPETPISNLASVAPPTIITDPNLNNNVATDGPDIRGIFRNGFESP
jgi:uncharacterized delta-60 repeat protein/uncharacterized repeat protein (TIGR01451 family)